MDRPSGIQAHLGDAPGICLYGQGPCALAMVVLARDEQLVVRRSGPQRLHRLVHQVPQVHGLTESGGFVYASSLKSGTIVKIDDTADVEGRTGSVGSAVGRYLWPVGLADVTATPFRVLPASSTGGAERMDGPRLTMSSMGSCRATRSTSS